MKHYDLLVLPPKEMEESKDLGEPSEFKPLGSNTPQPRKTFPLAKSMDDPEFFLGYKRMKQSTSLYVSGAEKRNWLMPMKEQRTRGISTRRLSESLSSKRKSLKGTVINSSQDIKEEEEKDERLEIIINNLASSLSFKHPASYVTNLGTVVGILTISPYFVIFDPEFSEANKSLICNESELAKYQCLIDMADVLDCLMIALPSPTAIENEEQAYYDDYYIHLTLARAEGRFFTGVPVARTLEPPVATVHFKLDFSRLGELANYQQRKIATTMAEQVNVLIIKWENNSIAKTESINDEKLIKERAEHYMKQLQAHRIKLSPNKKSEILTEPMLIQLGASVPALSRIKEWDLLFSISTDGVSMHSFYSKTEKYCPTIILVKDTKGRIFGAYATEKWHPSTRFYGTGESFLFKFNKYGIISTYKWSVGNSLFMYSDSNIIAVGGGRAYGLVIEENFSQGRTAFCETFENDPLVPGGEFTISNFEVIGALHL